MKQKIYGNILNTCDALGGSLLVGTALENADPRLLDVREEQLDEHVAMQPGAIAYFSNLKKDLDRQISRKERAWKRHEKEMYVIARKALIASGEKHTREDIDAKAVVDNKVETEKYEDEMDKLRKWADALDSWYEAWKQKSFTMSTYAGLHSDEWNSNPHLTPKIKANQEKAEKATSRESIKRIKGIIRKSKQKEGGANKESY